MVTGDHPEDGWIGNPYRRVRLLDVPAASAARFAEAVRFLGGDARLAIPRPAPSGPGKLADAQCAALEPALRSAAQRILSAHRDLHAALIQALDAYAAGLPHNWACGDRILPVAKRPLVMGVLNVTPDSFSDGGEFFDLGAAEEQALAMVAHGADIIDVGGESTRPGSTGVATGEEMARVCPVIERLAGKLAVPISIDTMHAEVARAAVERGATIINDVNALQGEGMLSIAAHSGAGVVLMHMRGTPATMQEHTDYDDIVREIYLFLHRRVTAAIAAGIDPERICIDPGLGFAKTTEQNLTLLARLREFTSMGQPVMAGPSRKGFLGKILDLPVTERVDGTAAACAAAVLNGASVVRVHDVERVMRAVRVAAAIRGQALPDAGLTASLHG
jgi:dihydropteroate synthase